MLSYSQACAVLLDELARETTGVEKDRVSTDLARQLQTDKERADKILVVYVSSGVFVGGLKKIG